MDGGEDKPVRQVILCGSGADIHGRCAPSARKRAEGADRAAWAYTQRTSWMRDEKVLFVAGSDLEADLEGVWAILAMVSRDASRTWCKVRLSIAAGDKIPKR